MPLGSIEHLISDKSPCRISTSLRLIRELVQHCSRVMCPKCRMVLKDRNGTQGTISAYYEPPTFGAEWAAKAFKDMHNDVAYAEFVTVFGEPMIYRHPDVTPLVEIAKDDDEDDTDEPPMVPAFLANMTDEERKKFVARFNGARMVCADPLTIRLPTDDELAPFVQEPQSLPEHDN